MGNSEETMSIGHYFEQFVTEQIANGRYDSSAEVLRAGLRLLEEHELALREQKTVMQDDHAELSGDMSNAHAETDQVSQTATQAMRALASAASDQMSPLPAIPVTKGLLRSRIAAE